METIKLGRRKALGVMVSVAAGATLGMPAFAQDLPHLEETDATAAALGYKHDTTKVDQGKYAQHKPEQKCLNCNLIQGKDGDAWRPCAIFPGKAVNAEGWCAAYVLKK